jgi:hypothetical protein
VPRGATLHAATAAHLERTLPDPAEVGWILAYHWREAGEPAKAIAYLLGSARRTADALAIEDTWDLYTRALGPRGHRRGAPAIRLKRGLAMADLEDYSRAKRELGELVPELTGRDLIEALIAQGHSTTWTEDSDATIEIAPREPSSSRRRPATTSCCRPPLALLSGGYGMRGEEGDLHRRSRTGEARDGDVGPRDADALARRGLPHAGQPLLLAGALRTTPSRSSRLEVEPSGDPQSAEFLLRGAGMKGLVLSGLGRYEEALTAVETAISIANAMGRPVNVGARTTRPDRCATSSPPTRPTRAARRIADRLGPSDFNMPWINARADVIAADLIRGEYGRVEVRVPGGRSRTATNSLAWERWARSAGASARTARSSRSP